MKKIVSSILALGVLININADTDLNNKIDSYKLYNTDLEKIILEEMVSSITHEENIFNMFNDYILKTGDTNITNFYNWYKIENNYNNNFVKAFNHNNLIELEYNQSNGSLLIKKTFKKENSFASKKYMEELKNRSIRFSFDADGYSIVAYKLPLKTIKFIDKYKEIKAQGLGLVNENELDNPAAPLFTSIPINNHIYVPNGEGGFLLYEKKLPTSNYLGLVNTFDGVFIKGTDSFGRFLNETEIINELSLKLPKIKGSIGYVVTNIDNNEKSAIVEYIYNGTTWIKRFSSVNTQLTIRTKIYDYNENSLNKSNSSDLSIDEPTLNFFDSAFIGGLYNISNVLSQSNPILAREFENFGSQKKTAIFKDKYLANTYDFKKINAFSNIYSISTKDNLVGSTEEIFISAENHNLHKDFKADTSACAIYGYDYSYNDASDKCVKSVTSCSDTSPGNYGQKSINGSNYCYIKNTTTAAAKVCDLANSNSLVNGAQFEYLPSKTQLGCVDTFWGNIPNNDPYKDSPYDIISINNGGFTTNYRVDTVSPVCNDFKDNSGLMIVSSENDSATKPIGCYWYPIQNNDIKDPICNADEIRVGGVCKGLVDGDITNAGCVVTNSEINTFNSLVSNYMFQKSTDASKYLFDNLIAEKHELSITEPVTGNVYKICDYVNYQQKGFKKSYVFPKINLKIDNVTLQGKNEIKTNPMQIIYREINISECDILKTNCKSVFDKTNFNNGLQNNSNVKFNYGEVFYNSQYLNFNTTTRYFEINKSDYTNNQLLPLTTYNTYDEIKNNLNNVINHTNNRMIKFNSYKFDIVNGSSTKMILDSGEINLNE